ncbi:MAG: DUF4349 domain-containing protein [Aigarchaeota archaeon]|nr:DUF4349 domain-containing protein [Aigarchaeota archaeon]MDW8021909.1 DUF4349 domain-containing protein [Nitrososphaerota archaeon]
MKLDRKIIAILVVAFITASYGAGLILTNYMKNIGTELLPYSADFRAAPLNRDAAGPLVPETAPAIAPERGGYETSSERLLVRTASLYMESEDPGEAVNKIIMIVESYGGYVAQLNMFSKENPSASILVKVPEKFFFQALSEIKRVGEVVSEEVNARDVTEQYVDLEARLRNLRAEEEWLLKTMEKARNVEELMMVEKELWRIREEIERLEAQMKNLERMVQYSSISITVTRPSPPTPPPSPYPEIDFTPVLVAALTALIYIAYGLVFLIIIGIPLGAIAYAGYILYEKVARRRRG